MTIRSGSVYLVGAGPGDPGLITARGLELLRRADVVVHDQLIAHELLAEVRGDAEVIDAGKGDGWARLTQEQTNALLVERARAGAAVVRLKGGDPFVFGRGWEELGVCESAGVACEVVPGVTSALAAPALAGIPATVRGAARSVAIVTARADGRDPNDDPDLAHVAHADTLVVLMGVRSLPSIVRSLVEAGRSPSTPVSIVERGGMPGQRRVDGTLGDIADRALEEDVRPPAVVVVGHAASFGRAPGPLARRRIVVTRPADAAHELAARLRGLGADVIHVPLIRIAPIDADRSWIEKVESFDWIVATSRHGARGFVRELRRAGRDARALQGARVAAVGPTTAREFISGGLVPDVVPQVWRASGLIVEIASASRAGARVLFACGTLARDELADGLRDRGLAVTPLVVYETTTLAPGRRERSLIERGVDAVLFASPSAVRAWVESGVRADGAACVCMGPTTAAEARRLGIGDPIVAEEHSDEGLARAAARALSGREEVVA